MSYLAAVAEYGSVTTAARHIGVSQPVLSRALTALQEELNAPLLTRRNRRLVLTADGQAVLGPARRALLAVEDVRRTALRNRNPPLMRIAAESTLLSLAAPTLLAMLEMEPAMHVQVVAADTPEALDHLISSGRADIAFAERLPLGGIARWTPWGQAELVLASRSGQSFPDELDAHEISRLRLISIVSSNERQRSFDDFFVRAGTTPNIVLELEMSA